MPGKEPAEVRGRPVPGVLISMCPLPVLSKSTWIFPVDRPLEAQQEQAGWKRMEEELCIVGSISALWFPPKGQILCFAASMMEQTSYVYDSRKRVNKTSWYLASPAAFICLAVRLCAVHTVLVLGWHLFWPLNFMLPPLSYPPPWPPHRLLFLSMWVWSSVTWALPKVDSPGLGLGGVQAFPLFFVQGSSCDCKIIVWRQHERHFTCGECREFCFFFK